MCPVCQEIPSERWEIGVTSYDVSLEKQEVVVSGTIPYDDVLAKIKKTGKEVCRGTFFNWSILTHV